MSTVEISFRTHLPSGETRVQGIGAPAFDLYLRNERGMRAFRSLSELRIAEAYVRGDIEIEGDAIKAMWLRDMLSDRNVWLKLWRRVQPLVFGRERLNPSWIAKHYDSKNVQTLALDRDYYAYTPGIYLSEDETLEQSSQRKYEFAWESLQLRPGMELLEIGCGWGGMTRFCASRGVRVTGITLSRDQLAFTSRIIEEQQLDAEVHYQDFFTYEPGRRFDAISCMGVIEDLSDYARVMARFAELLKPRARAYLDFAAGKEPVATSSFITKYIWPGTFRMVYMPELMEAIDKSAIELQAVWNDRHNYYLWARNGAARWVENRERVVEQAGEEIYRLFHLLFLGTAGVMSSPRQDTSAYRMLLSNG
jgi:cyclopropane-fatty-acyl-phospholipid synthase